MTTAIETGFNFESLPVTITYLGVTKRNEWDCFMFNVFVGNGTGQFTTPYYTGMGHINKRLSGHGKKVPNRPKIKDIMYSLLLDASATNDNFNDWCSNYGYSTDSIAALNMYKSCLDTSENLRKVFSREQLDAMQEDLQGY